MNSAHKWLSRVFSLETERRLKHEHQADSLHHDLTSRFKSSVPIVKSRVWSAI